MFKNSEAAEKFSSGIFGFDANGSFNKNSRDRQTNLRYYGGTNYQSFSKDHPESPKDSRFQFQGHIENVTRFFIKPKVFFEAGGHARYSYSTIKTDNIQSGGTVLRLGVAPKLGFGRVENISDAWHVVTIIEELQKAGSIKKQLTHEEITALANEIRRLKNARNVDLRLENIYEFEQLAKYLVENEIADGDDYSFYAILNDAYAFEDFALRQQGQAFTVGTELDYQYDKVRDADLELGFRTYALALGFEKHNAVSTDWQFDQCYTLKGGIGPSFIRGGTSNDDRFVELVTHHTLGYFLNRRTNLSLPLRTETVNTEGKYSFGAYVSPTLSYYFSPQLRLRVSGRIELNRNELGNNLRNNEYASLSAGVNYFLY